MLYHHFLSRLNSIESPLRHFLVVVAVVVAAGYATSRSAVQADEKLKGIACRSVHLGYNGLPKAIAFYNEISIQKSARGTYFAVCAWDKGYFGLQELSNGKKLLIFSVWDPTAGDDPNSVEDDKRVKLLHRDEKVRVGRFGNEGTGGQSFFDYDWKNDTVYRLMVTANPAGERTEYTGYFYVPEDMSWKKLVTFSTITGGKPLGGYYSFVEDFRRNRISATQERRATFGNAWIADTEKNWVNITNAKFTGDSNPVMNIDSGLIENRFFLATGGDITNQNTPLREVNRLPESAVQVEVPKDIKDLLQQ